MEIRLFPEQAVLDLILSGRGEEMMGGSVDCCCSFEKISNLLFKSDSAHPFIVRLPVQFNNLHFSSWSIYTENGPPSVHEHSNKSNPSMANAAI